MSLYATYADWITGVRDWLDADHLTDAQVEGFIALAQERMNRELAAWEMEETEDQVVAASLVNLPADFNRIRQVSIAGLGTFDASTKGEIINKTAQGDETRRLFAIDAGTIILWPAVGDGAVVTIDYYVKVEPISLTLDSNIFTDSYARLLLWAALIEGSKFIVEDDRSQGFERDYATDLEIANQVPKRIKMGSTPLRRLVRTM